MSFGSCWGNLLSPSYKNVNIKADVEKATEAFDAEFEAFCAEQKKIKAEKEAKIQAEEKPQNITEDIGSIPSEEVVEEAYKAFDIPQEILDAEKAGEKTNEEAAIKESKKRRSKKVTEETASDETLAF
jgi:preprotein translocase subunit SecA